MLDDPAPTKRPSVCPHDCPSTCALEVEVFDDNRIGRVRGAKDNSYTAGVICAKVARYAERIHHPDRLTRPLIRKGAKGDSVWQDISWDAALDLVAEKFNEAEHKYGSETVWPYFYAGTMGLVQRDSIERLRHARKYSGQFSTICVNTAWTGFSAGTGALMGPDPREMAKSDCIVIWGTNAVATQVNVMTHAIKARKSRGAKIVVIDVYNTETMRQADLALCLKPSTDAALACAVMHCLFRDGHADRAYLETHSDDPAGFEAHLSDKTPEWASAITGLGVDEIEAFAALLAANKRSYLRLGYGFTRCRNGSVAMHAATSVATVLGSWQYEGGGAFHANGDIFGINSSEIKGAADPSIRQLDQSLIGRILTGDSQALHGGPPVTAMLIQNTNPVNIAPEQDRVRRGFLRDDLFVTVHEQFMTETAQLADLVLPATMFLEHDDIYRGGGQQHITLGAKLIDPPEGCRSNHFVIEELAKRLGVADQPGFGKSTRELLDSLLKLSNRGTLAELEANKWLDCQPDFETSHYVNGFAWPDGKFRFKPRWDDIATMRPPDILGLQGDVTAIPVFPDHWENIDAASEKYPFRLTTSPAHHFLNSSFTETPTSRAREARPSLLMHEEDAAELSLNESDEIVVFNKQGEVFLNLKLTDGQRRGVVVAEGLFPNSAHRGGRGINTLTAAEPLAPHGGAAFHDVSVGIRKAS